MIDGIGIDVVDISRFQESLERTPALKEKLFTAREAVLPISSLAARFAAKEARYVFAWHDCEVVNEESGRPAFIFTGGVAERIDGATVHLTLSHDAGIASAMVIVERT